MFVVYITLAVGFKPFLGKLKTTPKTPHEAPFKMLFGPMILALLGIVLGIFSSLVISKLINNTELGIINERLNIPVKLWHGFNLELGLSIITVLLGVILYIKRDFFLNYFISFKFPKYLQPSFYYDLLLSKTLVFAKLQSNVLQNGYLRYYVITIVLTTILIAGYSLLSIEQFSEIKISFSPTFSEIIIGILIISASIFAVVSNSRLTAIVAVGVVGYSVALIFIFYSAPDLAMTQFAIETLTVILFVLIIYKLPKYVRFTKTKSRIRDIIIAGAGGLLISLITLVVISYPMNSELKNYFTENSLTIGKGRNIVNVILVDFRALDTMGEITVLAIAAIGVFALLKLKKGEQAE
jgi:multicomponent Na+:H+ antiporter subunit A